ncbi:425_t:CDS:2, partial [Ambispora gerdemannii]
FHSIEEFLSGLGMNWRNIPRFQKIIEQFDQERFLDEERLGESLTEEEINEFIRQIDKQLTEKGKEEVNLFYTAVTRAKKELYLTASCQEECSRFIKYLNPSLIELQPSDLKLTPTSLGLNRHVISGSSIAEIVGERGEEEQRILDQQIHRRKKIQENFSSSKAITYLLTSPTGELSNDVQSFLWKKEVTELVITHHDKVHGKTWEAEYNIKRIDE